MNVSQLSARDINITARGATSTLSTSQLALVDGRSIYLDFYGMVMWDFVPANPHEIKQIEVIRGPASAVWGANAMSGVVNVITKSPRELAAERGTSLTIGAGGFVASAQGVDRDPGSLFYVNGSHAQAVDDRWAYKLSAGYFTQDPLPRPVGTINNALNTPYPPYTNTGTSQPKFDTRVDYTLTNGGVVTFSGGVGGTEGIIHTGIGPFDIQSGSRLGYFSTKWQQGARRVAFFTNLLDADAVNLVSRGATGEFLPLGFKTKTFDVEAGEARAHRHAARPELWRQLPPQHLRRDAGAQRRRSQRGRRLHPGRDLLSQQHPVAGGGARGQVLVDRGRRLFAADDAAAQARPARTRCACRSTGRSAPRRTSTTTWIPWC